MIETGPDIDESNGEGGLDLEHQLDDQLTSAGTDLPRKRESSVLEEPSMKRTSGQQSKAM